MYRCKKFRSALVSVDRGRTRHNLLGCLGEIYRYIEAYDMCYEMGFVVYTDIVTFHGREIASHPTHPHKKLVADLPCAGLPYVDGTK